MAEDDSTAAETYELYGPKNYSMAEIAELVDREIIKHRRHINVPKRFLAPMAQAYNKLIWWSQTCADGVEREFIDQKIDPNAKNFKDLGIEPGDISNFTYHYLVSTHIIYFQESSNILYSKIFGVLHTTTCRQQQNESDGRRRNICMSSTINKYLHMLGRHGVWRKEDKSMYIGLRTIE